MLGEIGACPRFLALSITVNIRGIGFQSQF